MLTRFRALTSVDDLAAELAELRDEVRFLREAVGGAVDTSRFNGHPHVTLGEGVDIAAGVTIWAGPDRPVSIGEKTRIYRGTEMIGPIRIGERSMVNRDGYVRAEVSIGDRVAVGPFCRFVSDNHDLGPSEHRAGRFHSVPIVVEDGVWIGAGVTILGGVTIGRGSVIAAGAVVASDVPPNVLVAGVPATVRKSLD